jgi:hypothetical protein
MGSNEMRVTRNDDGSFSLQINDYGMSGESFSGSLSAQSMKELPGKIEELFAMREKAAAGDKKKGPKNVTNIGKHLGCSKCAGKTEESEDD